MTEFEKGDKVRIGSGKATWIIKDLGPFAGVEYAWIERLESEITNRDPKRSDHWYNRRVEIEKLRKVEQ